MKPNSSQSTWTRHLNLSCSPRETLKLQPPQQNVSLGARLKSASDAAVRSCYFYLYLLPWVSQTFVPCICSYLYAFVFSLNRKTLPLDARVNSGTNRNKMIVVDSGWDQGQVVEVLLADNSRNCAYAGKTETCIRRQVHAPTSLEEIAATYSSSSKL